MRGGNFQRLFPIPILANFFTKSCFLLKKCFCKCSSCLLSIRLAKKMTVAIYWFRLNVLPLLFQHFTDIYRSIVKYFVKIFLAQSKEKKKTTLKRRKKIQTIFTGFYRYSRRWLKDTVGSFIRDNSNRDVTGLHSMLSVILLLHLEVTVTHGFFNFNLKYIWINIKNEFFWNFRENFQNKFRIILKKNQKISRIISENLAE